MNRDELIEAVAVAIGWTGDTADRHYYFGYAGNAIKAINDAGLAVVPREPNEEMIRAGGDYEGADLIDAQPDKWWKAMIQSGEIK